MDIRAAAGTKVKCISLSKNDYGCSSEDAQKHLVLNKEYIIDYTEVHSFHTKVFLKEIPGIAFNSCRFE